MKEAGRLCVDSAPDREEPSWKRAGLASSLGPAVLAHRHLPGWVSVCPCNCAKAGLAQGSPCAGRITAG